LTEIFHRLDLDDNGFISRQEFDLFQVMPNVNVVLLPWHVTHYVFYCYDYYISNRSTPVGRCAMMMPGKSFKVQLSLFLCKHMVEFSSMLN